MAEETWERQRTLWEEDRVGSEMAYLPARYRAETPGPVKDTKLTPRITQLRNTGPSHCTATTSCSRSSNTSASVLPIATSLASTVASSQRRKASRERLKTSVAGVSLAQLSHNDELIRRVHPLVNFFLAIFFVTLGIHMEIGRGEYVSIAGPSGCGKSTLLSILGLLDSPTGGEYNLAVGLAIGARGEPGVYPLEDDRELPARECDIEINR